MTKSTAARVRDLRAMAREFRDKVSETSMAAYVDLMLRSAEELEELADDLERAASEHNAAVGRGRAATSD
jgi:hypothetical protein